MNLEETLKYLYNRKNYEERRMITYDKKNYNVNFSRKLLSLFNNPDSDLRVIHVAGTNGKGSTCFYIEQILLASGYKTGTFMSPHVKKINERIRINGKPVDDDSFMRTIELIKNTLKADITPTTFELLFLASMIIFKNKKIDFAVIETGVGGRLDSTNSINPELTIITPIGIDHQETLGNTIKKIAVEKAGIIKKNVPCVAAAQSNDKSAVNKVINERAGKLGSQVYRPIKNYKIINDSLDGIEFKINENTSFMSLMPGEHQIQNFLTAFKAAEILKINPDINKLKERMRASRLPARLQYFKGNPSFLVDGGHNIQSISKLVDIIKEKGAQIILILSILKDKKIKTIVESLTAFVKFTIFTASKSPRSSDPEDISKYCKNKYIIESNSQDAFKKALEHAASKDIILIAGSFYLAGEILPLIERRFI